MGEFSFEGSFDCFWNRDGAVSSGVIAIGSAWRQLDETHSLESTKDFPCSHVFEVSIGLVPVPLAA